MQCFNDEARPTKTNTHALLGRGCRLPVSPVSAVAGAGGENGEQSLSGVTLVRDLICLARMPWYRVKVWFLPFHRPAPVYALKRSQAEQPSSLGGWLNRLVRS